MRGSPGDAVRSELRLALHDLSDVLQDRGYEPAQVMDAVRHASILADLAEVRDGVVPLLLRNLEHDLSGHKNLEAHFFATELASAANRM